MLMHTPPRSANLLDQRFLRPPIDGAFELRCSLMLASQGVYLADVTPEAFIHICKLLHTEEMQQAG